MPHSTQLQETLGKPECSPVGTQWESRRLFLSSSCLEKLKPAGVKQGPGKFKQQSQSRQSHLKEELRGKGQAVGRSYGSGWWR